MSDWEVQRGAAEAVVAEPRTVSAGRGWYWISAGFNDHYAKAQLSWIVVTVLVFGISLVIAMIPVVNIAGSILGTLFTGGLMLGCHAQRRGEPFRIGYVFAAFSHHAAKLAVVGLIYTIASAVVVLLPVLAAGISVDAAEQPSGSPLTVLLAGLVALALLVPVVMAYLFAPALVVLEGCSPIDAMKRSFIGCLRNVVPFLVYGAAMFAIMIVAAIPLGLGFLIAIPTIIASIYAAWQDIFEAPDSAPGGFDSGP